MLRSTSSKVAVAGKSTSVGVKNVMGHAFSTSAYPFRPGYGLGSWIPPAVVEGMESEAKVRSKIVVVEQILTDMESTSRAIKLEMGSIQNKQSSSQTIPLPGKLPEYLEKMTESRTKMWDVKIDSLTELFALQMDLANSANPQLSVQTFNAGAMSPVDWEKSKIEFSERAADSLRIDSRFFNYDKSTQSGKGFASDVSASATAAASLGVVSVSAGVASKVEQSVASTAERRTIEKTLLVTGTATHRRVKQFESFSVDELLLMNGWNFYHGGLGVGSAAGGDDKLRIDLEKLAPSDLMTATGDQIEKVSLVTEIFMGSTLIGTVHFIKTSATTSQQSTMAAGMQAAAKFSACMGAIAGDTSVASKLASKASNMASNGQYDIKFDLFCLGYAPKVKSSNVQYSIKQFKEFDPQKFAPPAGGNESNTEFEEAILTNQNASAASRQGNMKAVIDQTILSLGELDSPTDQVFDLATFMNCFDDYAENAPMSNGGTPLALNIRSYTRAEICQVLWRKWIVTGRMSKAAKDVIAPDEGAGDTKAA